MRILHLTTTYLPTLGGGEIAVHNVASKQLLKGHDPIVLVRFRNWKKISKLVPYKVIPIWPFLLYIIYKLDKFYIDARFLLTPMLSYYQRKYNFDIFHVHFSYPTGYLFSKFAIDNNIPYIVTCQGVDIQTYSPLSYGFRLIPKLNLRIKKTLQCANAVTAISASVKELYFELDLNERNIFDIPNGVDYAKFSSINIVKSEIKEHYGIANDKFMILTVGRNHPKKGYIHIPEIIRLLLTVQNNFIWVIAGKDCNNIQELAKSLNVETNLLILNEIGSGNNDYNNVPSYELIEIYKSAELFVFPTLLETFGVVFVEAMASGLPIVTTNAPGARDVIHDNVNGLLGEVADNQIMVNNILRLMDNSELRKTISENNMKQVRKYSWDVVADQYLDAYRVVLDRET